MPSSGTRVLVLSRHHPTSYKGGAEEYAHQIATQLSNLGLHTTYISLSSKTTNHKHLPYHTDKHSLRHIIKHKPMFVHINGSSPKLFVHGLISRMLGCTIIHHYFAPSNNSKTIFKHTANLLTRIEAKIYACTLVINQKEKHRLEHYGQKHTYYVPPHVPNHIQKQNQHQTQISNNILFVGKLDKHHYYKGIPILLRAMTLLPEKYTLTIVADGELCSQYQKQTIQQGIQSRVRFVNQASNQKLNQLYAQASVFVLPSVSTSEGFGIVLLEAIAHNTPVVTTNVVGASDGISQYKLGKIVPPNNPQQLAKAIRTTKPISEKWIKRRNACLARFTPEQMHVSLKDIYQHLRTT